MGGKALKQKGIDARRFDSEEMESFVEKFTTVVEEALRSETAPYFVMETILPLMDKKDHGDLDLVILCEKHRRNDVEGYIYNELKSKAMKRNGHCTSMEWDGIQLDLLFVHDIDNMNWAAEWYSHGDLSGILGRVFRYYHFIYGQDGLYFKVSYDNLQKKIFLGLDRLKALRMMGYKPVGPVGLTEEDTFEYVMSSAMAHPSIFDRIDAENKRRNTQVKFFEWVKQHPREGYTLYERDSGWTFLKENYPSDYKTARKTLRQMKRDVRRRPYKRTLKKLLAKVGYYKWKHRNKPRAHKQ